MTKILSLILLFTLYNPLLSMAQAIPDFSVNYAVKLNGLQAGELKRSLITNEDGSRLFKSETQAKGVFSFFKPDLVEESSVWQWNNNTIQPLSYLYQRTGGKKDKYMHLHFDWQSNILHIDDRNQPWTLKLEQNTLDKLVYQLALMSDLPTKETTFSYRIADGGKIKTYNINVITEELIITPLGRINTIKLTRHRNKKNDRQTTLWCAPTLNYLPVKLEHTEKGGSVFTAVIRQLRGFSTKDTFQTIKPAAHDSDIVTH